MRRHVATFVAAALLLASVAGPVTAGAGPRAVDAVTGGVASTAASADPADPTGRWIVLYKGGTDAASATRVRTARGGFHADRTFTHGIHGFSARLTGAQVDALRRDSAVAQVVPDERIQVEGQINPTGISRIGARVSKAAKIDGIDDRVDADVAIVDTGIAKVPDLNVVGGHDCSTSTPTRWRDVYGHGTHVAGTVGAIDNGAGVVGVAPGVRLWAVKVIDDTGSGLLSWYACGIDWVYAQRDPLDPSKPLIEAVNMSVTKWVATTAPAARSTTTSCTPRSAASSRAASRASRPRPTTAATPRSGSPARTTRSSRCPHSPTPTASPAAWVATAASRGARTTATTRSPTSATTAPTST